MKENEIEKKDFYKDFYNLASDGIKEIFYGIDYEDEDYKILKPDEFFEKYYLNGNSDNYEIALDLLIETLYK